MNRTRSVLAVWVLAAVASAQSGGQPAHPAEYDKLVADWTATTNAYSAAVKKLTESDAYKAAVEKQDSAKLAELRNAIERPSSKPYGERALQLADQSKGDDALLFLGLATEKFADADIQKGVLERVQKHFVKSAELGVVLENAMSLSRLAGLEETRAMLDKVIAENKNAMPRAWALYWKAMDVQRNRKATAEEKAAAEKWIAEAGKLAAGTELGDRIDAPQFEKEHLQIGMEAPNIQGADLDGTAFELKDYRGKVVVVDFWGFW